MNYMTRDMLSDLQSQIPTWYTIALATKSGADIEYGVGDIVGQAANCCIVIHI